MPDLFDDYSTRLQLEKLVIGLEEPILIKGVGRFIAKVDSGNGGYNVLHGENVIQQGDVITFKTYDENDQPKMVSRKLKEFINVNIGSGNIEQRPVIELDVQFAGDLYKKIPFSIANRNSNSHKILICKDFVKDELDALIDPAGEQLTAGNKKVEYVKEAANKEKLSFKKLALKGIRGLQSIGNQNANLISTEVYSDYKDKEDGYKDNYQNQALRDKEQIKKELSKIENLETYGINDGKIALNDFIQFKLLDYQGHYFGSKNEVVASEKQMFNEYQQLQNNEKNTIQQKNVIDTTNNNQNQQDNNQEKQENTQQPEQNNQEKFTSKEEILNRYKLRNKFSLYFVIIERDIKFNQKKKDKLISKILEKAKLSYFADSTMKNLGNNPITKENAAIKQLVKIIKTAFDKAKITGEFIFACTVEGQRIIQLFDDNELINNAIENKEEDEETIYDSFIPCLNRYYNRLGYNVFLNNKSK